MRRVVVAALVGALTIFGTSAPVLAANPVSSTWHLTCNGDLGSFEATSVFFPKPDGTAGQPGGATSVFRITDGRRVAIVFTPGTEPFTDGTCLFSWVGGKSPEPWFSAEFEADVYIPPR